MTLCAVELKSKHRIFFRPFPELSVISGKASTAAQHIVASIEAQIFRGDFAVAERESNQLAALALRGIDFYDTFDQNRLKWIVTSGYILFALYTLLYTIMIYGPTARLAANEPSVKLDVALAGIATGVAGLFMMEKTPWYCLYTSFPLFFARCLLQFGIKGAGNLWKIGGLWGITKVAASAGASIAALFCMAVSSRHLLLAWRKFNLVPDRLQ